MGPHVFVESSSRRLRAERRAVEDLVVSVSWDASENGISVHLDPKLPPGLFFWLRQRFLDQHVGQARSEALLQSLRDRIVYEVRILIAQGKLRWSLESHRFVTDDMLMIEIVRARDRLEV